MCNLMPHACTVGLLWQSWYPRICTVPTPCPPPYPRATCRRPYLRGGSGGQSNDSLITPTVNSYSEFYSLDSRLQWRILVAGPTNAFKGCNIFR